MSDGVIYCVKCDRNTAHEDNVMWDMTCTECDWIAEEPMMYRRDDGEMVRA